MLGGLDGVVRENQITENKAASMPWPSQNVLWRLRVRIGFRDLQSLRNVPTIPLGVDRANRLSSRGTSAPSATHTRSRLDHEARLLHELVLYPTARRSGGRDHRTDPPGAFQLGRLELGDPGCLSGQPNRQSHIR